MFLLDSLLLAPGKAVIAMLEELAKKAQEEFLDDAPLKQELQRIYSLLEAGTISEKEFDLRESGLLQRLEQIARAKLEGAWEMPQEESPPACLEGDIVEVADMEPPPPVEERQIMRDVQVAPSLGRLELATMIAGLAPASQPVASLVAPPKPQPASEPPFDFARLASLLGTTQHVAPPEAVRDDVQRAEEPKRHEAPPPAAAPAALTMMQVIESTTRQLTMLKLKVSAITSVARTDDGWRVTAEMLERKSVPDTSDLLGVYELQLDHVGNLLRYERTHLRRRCDLG
jgi:hypothetical protein